MKYINKIDFYSHFVYQGSPMRFYFRNICKNGTKKIAYSKIELIEMSNCILIKKEVDESQNAKAYRIDRNNKRSTKICFILSLSLFPLSPATISLLLVLRSFAGAHTILIETPIFRFGYKLCKCISIAHFAHRDVCITIKVR